jgi:hypothetical protein
VQNRYEPPSLRVGSKRRSRWLETSYDVGRNVAIMHVISLFDYSFKLVFRLGVCLIACCRYIFTVTVVTIADVARCLVYFYVSDRSV